jgi:hypothetical protein
MKRLLLPKKYNGYCSFRAGSYLDDALTLLEDLGGSVAKFASYKYNNSPYLVFLFTDKDMYDEFKSELASDRILSHNVILDEYKDIHDIPDGFKIAGWKG